MVVMSEADTVKYVASLLRNIYVPGDEVEPTIEMNFIGPVERIATWLYGQGVRVHRPEVPSQVEEFFDVLLGE